MLSVEDFVPEGVELVALVVVWDHEFVACDVTTGEFVGITIFHVHWLMDVAQVVDEQAQGVTLCDVGVTRVKPILDIVVNVRVEIGVAILLADPGDDAGNGFRDVSGFDLGRLWVVGCRLAFFVNKWVIDEMEVTLPAAAMVLDVVGEGRALNVRIHVFAVDQLGIEILQVCELLQRCIQSCWICIGK